MKLGFANRCYLLHEPIPFTRNDKIVFGMLSDCADSFMMSATLMEEDNKLIFWITMDLGIVRSILVDVLYERLLEITDEVAKENFLVMATHTHSGPQPYRFPAEASHNPDFIETPDTLFEPLVSDMAETMKACFLECKASLHEFTADFKTVHIDGCYSNRNGLDAPCDKSITLIRFFRLPEKSLYGMWLNMSCHSTLIHPRNEKMSTDLVGQTVKKTALLTGIYPHPFCGCQGDTSTRLTRRKTQNSQEDFQQLEELSAEIVRQLDPLNGYHPLHFNQLIHQRISLGYDYEVDKNEAKKRLDAILKAQAQEPEEHRKFLYQGNIKIFTQRLNASRYHGSLDAHLLIFGALKIIVLNGELVNELGLKLVRHDPDNLVLIAGYCNHEAGYLVNQYEENFESIARIIPKGLPYVLIQLIEERLNALSE